MLNEIDWFCSFGHIKFGRKKNNGKRISRLCIPMHNNDIGYEMQEARFGWNGSLITFAFSLKLLYAVYHTHGGKVRAL